MPYMLPIPYPPPPPKPVIALLMCVQQTAYPCSTLAWYGMTSLCWLFLVFTTILPSHCLGCNAFTASRQDRREKKTPRLKNEKQIHRQKKNTVFLPSWTPFGLSLVNSFLQVMAETCCSLLMTKSHQLIPLYTVYDYNMLSTFYLKAQELWCTVHYITCSSTGDVRHHVLSTTQLVPQNAARVYCSLHNS